MIIRITRSEPLTRRELFLDLLLASLLLALTALMLLPGALALPMELWDEARNANNAIEMAKQGEWLVTTYGYTPDHWNTKPPLLIWMIAELLRSGMDPMLAVRLPSIIATMGSVLLVYSSCRALLQDRLAGLIAGLLVVCSVLFMGDHVGRTGDYDALLCLLNLGFVLCAGLYVDGQTRRPGFWIAAAAAFLVLAILTKGVAGGLAVPGVMAYAIVRRRLVTVLADWRMWLSFAGAAVVTAGYFVLRERLDPGYLAAVWNYDVTGTMLTVLEKHQREPNYYVGILIRGFEPAMLLALTLVAMSWDPKPRRRRLCLLMGLAALSCLVVISLAQTKLFWYAAPAVPLAAVAVGISTTTWLQSERSWPSLILLRRATVGLMIILALGTTFWFLNLRRPPIHSLYWSPDQVWYGSFIAQFRESHPLDGAIILDGGVPNEAGFRRYSPVAKFFIEDAERQGVHLRLLATTEDLPANAFVLSCDPHMRQWVAIQKSFATIRSDAHCVFGRSSRTAILSPTEPLTSGGASN